MYNADHTGVIIRKTPSPEIDDEKPLADEEVKASDELTIKDIPWSTLKHRLADPTFDTIGFAVSYY